MTEFRQASTINEPTSLLIGLAGGTGCGKTWTALEVAMGICENLGGKPVLLDTEEGRGLHYRKDFEYDYAKIKAPFSPEAYWTAIEDAAKAGYPVAIIDSWSHIWAGDGGLHDIQEAALDKMAGGVAWKMEKMSALAWKEPKQRYKKVMTKLLHQKMHLIFCLRAEQKLKVISTEVDGRKKTEFVDAGWMPICEKHFMFEMTVSFILDEASPGIPTPPKPGVSKLPRAMARYFPSDKQIGREAGMFLEAWSKDPHAGSDPKVFGTAEKRPPAAKKGEPGRLPMMDSSGAVTGDYANAGTWLNGFLSQLETVDIEELDPTWENNSDMFMKINGAVTKAARKAEIEKCKAILDHYSLRMAEMENPDHQPGDETASTRDQEGPDTGQDDRPEPPPIEDDPLEGFDG